ncbi:MAG: hypothetical protein VCC68_11950 [Myxococcota bacterium]
MLHEARPPSLLSDVIDNLGAVRALLEANAPYTPLGGWYRPDQENDQATSPL